MTHSVRVVGTPAPQGSKTHVGGGRMIESSKAVRPWREAVAAAWQARHGGHSLIGPVTVDIDFYIARPAGHILKSGGLRPTARPYPSVRPDLDKLIRSTLDALGTAGAYLDDSQVVEICATKTYADPSGAHISVTPWEVTP